VFRQQHGIHGNLMQVQSIIKQVSNNTHNSIALNINVPHSTNTRTTAHSSIYFIIMNSIKNEHQASSIMT
jgi:hypothetical protein